MADVKLKRAMLKYRQNLPLAQKVALTQQRIHQWYLRWNGKVYIAFSGGKDSTALLRLVRKLYPDTPAVFCDTGLQFPEVRKFALSEDNVTKVKPKWSYREVLERWGYPVVSKRVARYVSDVQNASDKNEATVNLRLTGYNRAGKYCPSMKIPDKWSFLINAPFPISAYCCDAMKKSPLNIYANTVNRYPLTGLMASDSSSRAQSYLKHGCLLFNARHPVATPMAFWTEQDVLTYIMQEDINIAPVYGDIVRNENGEWTTTGEHNTGCVFCAFGLQYDGVPNRFQRLKITHPKLHKYCMEELGMRRVLEFLGEPWE